MDVFKEFATDDVKENSGVWRPIGSDGAEVLVARSGNRAYSRLISRKFEEHQRALDLKNDAADELADKLVSEVMAETILLGWKGLEFKGKPLPYSKENARMLLGVRDFRTLISKLSNDFESYRLAQEAELEKN